MTEKKIEVGAFHRIPGEWWDLLLDGHLWLVTPELLPFEPWDSDGTSFALAFRYQAKIRDLRGSVRRPAQESLKDPWKAYVHRLDREKARQTGRLRIPLHEAVQAPPVPYLVAETANKIPPAKQRDYSTSIIRMLHQQAVDHIDETVGAMDLAQHPILGWLHKFCDCGSLNFREHPVTCTAYSMIGLIEFDMKKVAEPPERWLARNPWFKGQASQ